MEVPKPKIRNIVATIKLTTIPENLLGHIIETSDTNYDFDIDSRRITLETSCGKVFIYKTGAILILGAKSEKEIGIIHKEITEAFEGF